MTSTTVKKTSRKKRKSGIHQIRTRPIVDWVSGKCFSMVHQSNLVYNTCWEDPKLDRVALELDEKDNILVITSAGCNALDYALDHPNHIYAVDVNPRQNALMELKLAGIRTLDYEEFFQLFGQGRLPGFKEKYLPRLLPHLSPWSREYWGKKAAFFDSNRSFYFRGSSGSVAQFVNYYIDKIAKIRDEINALLEAETLEEQQEIYDRYLRAAFWNTFIRKTVGNNFTLAMMGVPRQQRQQVELHFGRGIAEFMEWCIETVFTRLPIQDNYFWRVYLCGEYSHHCCPEYLKEKNFQSLKEGLVDRVSVHSETVESFLRQHDVSISRYVLLDHMDWLSTYRYSALKSEWQAIVDRAAEDTRVLFRSGGLKVEYVDPINVTIRGKEWRLGDMLHYYTDLAQSLHEQDRVHTYGSFYIADLATA